MRRLIALCLACLAASAQAEPPPQAKLSELAASWASSMGRSLQWKDERDPLIGGWSAPAPKNPAELARALHEIGQALGGSPLALCAFPEGTLAVSAAPLAGCAAQAPAAPAEPIPEGDPEGHYVARDVPRPPPPSLGLEADASSFMGAPFNPQKSNDR